MTERRIGEMPFLNERQKVTQEVLLLFRDIEAQKKQFITHQQGDLVWRYAYPILSEMRHEGIGGKNVRAVALAPIEDRIGSRDEKIKNRRRRLKIYNLLSSDPDFQQESIETLKDNSELLEQVGKRILQLELSSLIEKDANIERYIHAEIEYDDVLANTFGESTFMEKDAVFIQTTPFSIEINIYDPHGDETLIAHQIITIEDEELIFNGEPVASFKDLEDIKAILRSFPHTLQLLEDTLFS